MGRDPPRAPRLRIGTRPEIRLEIRRDDTHLLTLALRAGDLLRGEDGTVWATVDGERDDIPLGPGDVYAVPRDRDLRVSAFGHARLELYGHGPRHYEGPQREPAHRVIASAWRAMVSGRHPALVSVRARAQPA